MERIFLNVLESLKHRLPEYEVILNNDNDTYFIYFIKDKKIVYLINITALYKSTFVLDRSVLVEIIMIVLKSRGLA